MNLIIPTKKSELNIIFRSGYYFGIDRMWVEFDGKTIEDHLGQFVRDTIIADYESDKAAALAEKDREIKAWRDMCEKLAETLDEGIDISMPDVSTDGFYFRRRGNELLSAYNAMKDGQPASEPTPQARGWVKCSERLPDDGMLLAGDLTKKRYIIMRYDGDKELMSAEFYGTGQDGIFSYSKDGYYLVNEVFAWLEVPDYKEAGK
jgi:hypothetical protein